APVNHIAVDPTGSLLLSATGDSSLRLWNLGLQESTVDDTVDDDLDAYLGDTKQKIASVSVQAVVKPRSFHKAGVSGVCMYVDGGLATTCSFDNTVRVWDIGSSGISEACSFDLGYKVYAHSLGHQANPLVATGGDHPHIRLIDLRTLASSQILRGHSLGKVLAVEWCPTNDYIIASGGSDGSVRLWDIRSAASSIACLSNKLGPVNGVKWHESGKYLVTNGNDEIVRLWSGVNQENLHVNYGPHVRNRFLQTTHMAITPAATSPDEYPLLLVPSDSGQVIMLDMFSGRLIRKLSRNASDARVTSVVCRGAGTTDLLTSAQDGTIRWW
ncbi:hypothetical protein CANCADRAFT_18821, partial [Tortispora caseinolytica NRRL Y-17796]